MRYKNNEDTDRVRAILGENEHRLLEIFGCHDQLSGHGMESHTWKFVLKDYGIKTQWLTEEFRENEFFARLEQCGSIGAYIKWYDETYGEKLSMDEVADEIFRRRCQRDPSFAFYTCYKIQDKKSGQMIPFRLNYAQRVLLEKLESMRRAKVPVRLVLLKARQWGGSTLVQLYMSWMQLFVVGGAWNSAIIAQTKDTSRRIKGMYRKVLDNFPRFIFGTELKFSSYEQSAGSDFIVTDARHTAVRDSVITVASYENFENTRGASMAMAHCSECAYWKATEGKTPEKLITGISGGILPIANTMIVLESTANGNSGYFYDQYQIATDDEQDSLWQSLFIPFFYIENDMAGFDSPEQKKAFVENLVAHRHETTAPSVVRESGKYLYELWEKGATLEHIKWYIQKRSEFTSHEQMASEAPSDDIECFTFSGHKVWSMAYIQKQKKMYERKESWIGDITCVDTWKRLSEGERYDRIQQGKADTRWRLSLTQLTSESTGLFKVWKMPDKLKTSNQYLVVVDVGGRGEKADYSVITVLNRWNTRREDGQLEVVARWRGHLRYDLMAWKAVAVARLYKNAMLVFESNTFDLKKNQANDYVEQGDHIRGILNVIGDAYDNLWTRPNTDAESLAQGVDKLIGFQTNKKTKQDIVDEFTVEFEDGKFIDHDKLFYVEAGIYEQRPDGSYGNIVGKGNHDDIVMTDMIGVYVHNRMDAPEVVEEMNMRYYQAVERVLVNESSF